MDIQPGQVYFDLGPIPFGRVDEFGVDWAIETFDGWGATSSTRQTVQKTRQAGGWSGDGFPKPRHLSSSGKFYAPTPEAAALALDRLNDAVSIYDTSLVVYEPGMTRSLSVHRVDDVLHGWVMPTVASWAFGLMADDPRKMGDELTASTGLPSSSGGLLLPTALPFSIDAVTNSGQVSLENIGNESGPVVLRISGPCTGPVITHVGSGLALVFASSLVLGAGEWLTVDMEARSVMANDQASRSGYVISRGWSNFTPGENTWAFTAASYNSGAQLTVSATPAWK